MYDPARPLGARDAAKLTLDANVPRSEGSESLSQRVRRVEASLLEAREERFAAVAHALDDGRVEGEVQFGLVRLGDASDEKNVVVARDEEDDLVGVVYGVGSDGQGRLDLGIVLAVVDDADKSAPNGIARRVASYLCTSQARRVNDSVSAKPCTQSLLLIEQVAFNSLRDGGRTFAVDKTHEPHHGLIGIDDRRQELVRIHCAVVRADPSLLYQLRVLAETPNATRDDLRHLRELSWVVHHPTREEKVGRHHLHACCAAELWNGGDGVPGMVGGHAPALRVGQRDTVGVGSADCWGVFPESAGDLRGEAVVSAEVGPVLRDDGDLVTPVEEYPGSHESGHACANDEDVGRGCGGLDKACVVGRQVAPHDNWSVNHAAERRDVKDAKRGGVREGGGKMGAVLYLGSSWMIDFDFNAFSTSQRQALYTVQLSVSSFDRSLASKQP